MVWLMPPPNGRFVGQARAGCSPADRLAAAIAGKRRGRRHQHPAV